MTFSPERYWEGRLTAYSGLEAVGYLGLGRSYNRWMYRIRGQVFRGQVRGLNLSRSARILDIGSGTGFYVDQWTALGYHDVTGCDLSSGAVRRLTAAFPGRRFLELDIGSREIPDHLGPFDAISCMDVLFHIVDESRYDRAMRNIGSLLTPGGVLLYSDNFLHGEPVVAEHQVSRTLARIESELARNGIEAVRRTPLFFLMNQPVDAPESRLARAWWRLLRWINRNEVTGFLSGAILYPLERLLVSTLTESPTTELMIGRKRE